MEMEVKLDPHELFFPDKLVDFKCEEKMEDVCLICLSKVEQSITSEEGNLLSNNLNVIFLLKKVLQVPNDLLVDNFVKCGCPAEWISLCENCSQLTSQAMEHHLQMLTLVYQLTSVLKIFTDKIKDSSVHSERFTSYQNDMDDKEKGMDEERLHILQRTREFVINYDYTTHLVNPFIEGDKLAREKELEKWEDNNSLSDDFGEEDVESAVGGDDWQIEKKDDKVKAVEIEGDLILGIPFSKLPKSRQVLLMGGKWKCRYCDKGFRTSGGAVAHEREKHPGIPGQFKCDICGKIMNSKGYLSTHLNKVHNIKAADNRKEGKGQLSESGEDKVTQEKEAADTRTNLTEKPVLFKFEKKWKCKYCGRGFMKKRSLKTHEEEQCPLLPGQFICDICGTTWDTKRLLWRHQRGAHRINKSGKPVKPRIRKPTIKPIDKSTCELCGKLFSDVYSLRKHVKYFHEKQFDIRCHVCGMGVYTNSGLKEHLISKHKDDPETLKLIEGGAKIWKCEVKGCRGTFWKESGLEEHKRKVHGDGGGGEDAQNRFTCSFCGKTFRNWYPFNCHEERHKLGAERPYSCDICGAKLKAVAYLRKHKRRFHPETL